MTISQVTNTDRASPITRFISLGSAHAKTPADTRWVRTINMVAGAGILSNLVYVFVFLAIDPGELVWAIVCDVVSTFALLSVIWANSLGHSRSASWMFLGFGWANVLVITSIFGGYTGPYLFLLLFPLLAGLFSGPSDRILPVVAIGLGVGLFAAAPLMFKGTLLEGTTALSLMTIAGAVIVGLFGSLVMLYYRRLVDRTEAALAEANATSDRLLLNILPKQIAERLKSDGSRIADRMDAVTVLFADLVGSTMLAEVLTADELVELFDRVFSHFDELADRLGLEKIATIGDGYLAAAGVPVQRSDHAEAAANMALAMLESLPRFTAKGYGPLGMRIGLHTGPVIAGVIGRRKFRYDIWGDTVNTASRMESYGVSGRVHTSAAVRQALGEKFLFEPRGPISIKGKGTMETFFLVGRQEPDAPGPGPTK